MTITINMSSVLAIIAAGSMAAKGIDGWGWFLMVAIIITLLTSNFSMGFEDEKTNPDKT